ncbi:MAG: hypoxanthine phosphoribosyltransferase [Eubacteriales bacterium]|nr:hypoxanthine phosphoribosyltransferase [Eubacteriales bacterium]
MIDGNYEILFSQESISFRVSELAAEITRDYAKRDLVLVAMLKGSIYFMADLTREIDLPFAFDLIGISSLGRASQETGIVRVTKDLGLDVTDKDVLIVEEIVRSGLTTNYLVQYLEKRAPRSIELVTLLHSPEEQLIDLPLKYTGFEIGYERVVGYGMDYREQDRALPFIAKLDESRYL